MRYEYAGTTHTLSLSALVEWQDYERKNRIANEEYERNRDTIDFRYGEAETKREARELAA